MINFKEISENLETVVKKTLQVLQDPAYEERKNKFRYSTLFLRQMIPPNILNKLSHSFLEIVKGDKGLGWRFLKELEQYESLETTFFQQIIVNFVCEYVYEAGGVDEFDEEAFMGVFQSLKENWVKKVHEITWWVALENFELKMEDIETQLSEKISLIHPPGNILKRYISEMSEDEISYLSKKFPPTESTLFLKINEASDGEHTELPTSTVKKVLFVLRLIGGGSVYPLGYLKMGDIGLLSSGINFSQDSTPDLSQYYDYTKINNNGLEMVRKLFIRTDFENSWYRVAGSRFMLSSIRSDNSDVLIDSVIGLESLLLPKDNDKELSFRFKLNGALLLAFSLNEAIELTSIFKEIYDTRSRIVHGGREETGNEGLYRISRDASDLLRRILFVIIQGNFESRESWDIHLRCLPFKWIPESGTS